MRPQLTQNLWERYGFRDNPFDTRALSLTPQAPLSVAEAFVGRSMECEEARMITNFFRSPGGGRVVVEGDVGVGKTTFVNYHRYLWETEAATKLLTPALEISVQSNWGAREFLLSVLGALAGRLALGMEEREVQKDPLLTEVFALTRVLIKETASLSGGLSVIGSGANFGTSKALTVQMGELTPFALMEYLRSLMARVRESGFAGAVLHLDNLELLARRDPADLIQFFDDVRDSLQQPGLYTIFVGYTGMFQEVIVPLERVRSIFLGHPIHLPPLALPDVHTAILRRYELLANRPGRWMPPVDDGLIDYLYEVFSGKIRFIMDAVTTLVTHVPEGVTVTMSADSAREVLRQLTQQKLNALLTEAELEVMRAAAGQGRFTNSSLCKTTGKSKQNIAKYVTRFLDLHLVSQAERSGRNVYYEVAPELVLLG